MTGTEQLIREEAASEASDSLMHAYLEDFERVSDLFAGDYRSIDSLRERAQALGATNSFPWLDRARIARKLGAYARTLGAPTAVHDSIRRLRAPETFAIVTGQQPSIAGGPAFVLYKAAHAIKLARELSLSGVPSVPVFWVASEDHDIDEINRFGGLDDNGHFKAVRLRSLPSGSTTPLDALTLPPAESEDTGRIRAAIPAGAHRSEAVELLARSLDIECGRGLARVLTDVFGDEGLIVLEPRLLRDLDGFKAVCAGELHGAREHHALVERALVTIRDRGYSLPLMPSPYTNLFYIQRASRRHVSSTPGGFEIEGMKRAKSLRMMLELLARSPQRFSTNVRLRPLVQGACLPTLAYVAGSSEISYHAALKPLFERTGVAMPLLVPRWSFVVVAGGRSGDLGRARDAIATQRAAAQRLAAAISETQLESRAMLLSLRNSLGYLAQPLKNDLDRMEGRLEKTLLELRGRLLADPVSHTPLPVEYVELATRLYPGNTAQERALSWLALWPVWRDAMRTAFSTRSAFDFSLIALKA